MVEPFTGKEGQSFNHFLKRRKIASKPLLLGCDEEDKRSRVRLVFMTSQLAGDARKYDTLPPATKEDYDALKSSIEDWHVMRWTSSDRALKAMRELGEAAQGTKRMNEYTDDMRAIYSALQREVRESTTEKMVAGITDKDIKDKVETQLALNDGISFEQVIIMMHKLDTLKQKVKSLPKTETPDDFSNLPESEAKFLKRFATMSSISTQELAKTIAESFAKMVTSSQQRPTYPQMQPPARIQNASSSQDTGDQHAPKPGEAVCFKCFKPRHFAGACPTPSLTPDERMQAYERYCENMRALGRQPIPLKGKSRAILPPFGRGIRLQSLNEPENDDESDARAVDVPRYGGSTLDVDTAIKEVPHIYSEAEANGWDPVTEALAALQLSDNEISDSEAGDIFAQAGEKRSRNEANLPPVEYPVTRDRKFIKSMKGKKTPRRIVIIKDCPEFDAAAVIANKKISESDGITFGHLFSRALSVALSVTRGLVRPTRKKLHRDGPPASGEFDFTMLPPSQAQPEVGSKQPRIAGAFNVRPSPEIPPAPRHQELLHHTDRDHTKKSFEVSRILLDPGSLVDLINGVIARSFSLVLKPIEPLKMRLTDGRKTQSTYLTTITLGIEGILRIADFVIMESDTPYSILLGCQALHKWHVKGDYSYVPSPWDVSATATSDQVLVKRENGVTSTAVPQTAPTHVLISKTAKLHSQSLPDFLPRCI